MTSLVGGGRWRRVGRLAIALYTLFLVTAPFAHHDLACHLKTPLHCAACASSAPSVHAQAPAAFETVPFVDAGRADLPLVLIESAVLDAGSSGRSPPSLA